jgi:hypothetical protein
MGALSGRAVALLVLILLGAEPLAAQGVTTASIRGTVLGTDGTPIDVATIQITNVSTGARWQAVTSSAGRYFVDGVDVGGPYLLEVRRVGYRPVRRTGITLTLGQRFVADWMLDPAAAELEPVTIEAASRSAGITEVISESTLARLPTLSRNFADLAILSPQVAPRPGGGISIGGQNQVYNALRIDGGENGDLYYGREPGGASPIGAMQQVMPRTISLEAVHEFRVLVTPFDVQEGAATGGVLSAVTRSGTNTHHGSAFTSFGSQNLAGRGTAAPDFTTWQWGGSAGGPIVRNRLHYFASADIQDRVVDDPGPLITDTAGGADVARIGISYANAARFQRILADSYALDPGTLGPVNGRIPAQDLFGKLTAQLGAGSHLEMSYHYAHADRRNFLDAGLLGYVTGAVSSRGSGYYGLSSVGEEDRSTAQTSRLIWRALVGGRWSNELIVSYTRLRDDCQPNATFPRIVVLLDTTQLVAGPNFTCPTNTVTQRVAEFTDNVTFGVGRHLLTFGTHDELLDFHDAIFQQSPGFWTFTGLDSLAAGVSSRYERSLPGPLGPGSNFSVRQAGAYVQDAWSPSERLSIGLGLRVDVPFLPDGPVTMPALQDSFGIVPGSRPSGNALWSPRVYGTFHADRDDRTTIRAGLGLFAGRPPYRWVGNIYRDGGLQEYLLVCRGRVVPQFEPLAQPAKCADSTGAVPAVSFFDRGVRFPQNLKITFGIDRRLTNSLMGTLEFLYTRGVRQLYYTDVNLEAPFSFELGEGRRPMYGTIDNNPQANAHPYRRDSTLLQVIRVSNRSGDRAASVSIRLEQRFTNGARLTAAYAYSQALDIFSANNFNARPILQGTPLDGTLEDRRLGTSFFDTPHRLTMTATFDLPFRVGGSLLYAGASGTPFTYIVNGDANADGMGERVVKNDIVYVPRDSEDVTLFTGSSYARLNSFIEAEPCLRKQRGRIMARNSCRNPWVGTLNARLTRTVGAGSGRSVEIGLDVFNVLNLLDGGWGLYRATTRGASVQMLRLRGYDAVKQRGRYEVTLPPRNRTVEDASRWQALLSARYVF